MVQFEDNSIRVMAALNEAAVAFLSEATHELQAQVQRNTAVGAVNGGDTKNSWQTKIHRVDSTQLEGVVGNPKENAIWEEFGTGEYALEGKGRKGGWYILIGEGEGQISQRVVDAYNFKVVEGKDGKKFAYTTGKRPKRPFQIAYDRNKPKLIRRARQIFKEYME